MAGRAILRLLLTMKLRPQETPKTLAMLGKYKFNRWSVAAAALCTTAWVIMLGMAVSPRFWSWASPFFYDPTRPTFADLKAYTWAMQVYDSGVDPLTVASSSIEPVYNYPRIWLHASALGLDRVPLVTFGLVFDGMLLVSLFFLMRVRDLSGVVLIAVVLASPPLHLLLERGNIDIAIFVLVVLGLYSGGELAGPAAAAMEALSLGIASILKLYPFAALCTKVVTSSRSRRWIYVVVALATALIFVCEREELKQVSRKTPRPHYDAAYGAAVLSDRMLVRYNLSDQINVEVGHESFSSPRLVASGIYLAAALTACWLGLIRGGPLGRVYGPPWKWCAFCSGVAIYCGSFLLGNNWRYRLVFLVLTFPYLLDSLASPDSRKRWRVVVTAVILITFCGPLHLPRAFFVLQQASDWAVGVILPAILVAHAFRKMGPQGSSVSTC
jgi:hypothetical protein